MAPRGDTARLAHRRRSSLQLQLSVGSAVLQQCSQGISPIVSSFVSSISRLQHAQQQRLQRSFALEGPQKSSQTYGNLKARTPLRIWPSSRWRCGHSSPYTTGDGPGPVYADIRNRYSLQLGRFSRTVNPGWWGRVCYDLLVPALLRTDTLQCYSRLLAQAADQLKPAAAAVLHDLQPSLGESELPSGAARTAEAAGAGCSNQGQLRAHRGLLEQRDRQRSRPPSMMHLEPLLRNVLQLLDHLTTGVQWALPVGKAPADHPTLAARGQLQSSWVLEHWAQVLLLGTAVASAEGDGVNRDTALGLQAGMLSVLCDLLSNGRLGLTEFLRRPCGCALAAAHMAQLCAALDGVGAFGAFGATKPDNFILPPYLSAERQLARCFDNQAARFDGVAHESNRAVSLHCTAVIVRAWSTLLLEAMAGGPDAVTGTAAAVGEAAADLPLGGLEDSGCGAHSGEGVAAPAHGAGKGLSCGGTAAGVGGRESAELARRVPWRQRVSASTSCRPSTAPPPVMCACAWPRGF